MTRHRHDIFAHDVVLRNPAVTLRPITAQDASALRAVAIDPDVWRFTVNRIADADSLAAYVETALEERVRKTRYCFVVVDGGGKVAGSTSFGTFSTVDRRVEIGWTWLGSAFQGREINLNAKYLLLYYAFEVLEMRRVEFKTDALNARSRAALRKTGAFEEGTLRSHTLMHDGRWRDTVYYGILHSEWPDRRRTLRELGAAEPIEICCSFAGS